MRSGRETITRIILRTFKDGGRAGNKGNSAHDLGQHGDLSLGSVSNSKK